MKLALIAAMDRQRVIGINNQLPWHLPNDLQYFKAATMGKPIIMGRKTYDSIGRPLPGRPNLVISRNRDFNPDGVIRVDSVESAIATAESLLKETDLDEAMVIGGAEIYRQTLPFADRLYLTLVDAEVEGDAWFPEWQTEAHSWQESSREDHPPCERNPYAYAFVRLDRVSV